MNRECARFARSLRKYPLTTRSPLVCRHNYGDLVNLKDTQVATSGKSVWEVLRGWTVLKLFTYDIMVNHNIKLYGLSKRIFGSWFTEKLLRMTVFGQFAGGVNAEESENVVRLLAERNISSIWFYSIERDLSDIPIPESQLKLKEQEKVFETINQKYLKSVEMSALCNCDRPVRFAAVKLTAIVNPHFLNKVNKLLVDSESVFSSLATPGKNTVDMVISPNTLRKVLPEVTLEGSQSDKNIRIADWTSYFSIADMDNLHRFEQLHMLKHDLTGFNDMELEQCNNFLQRLLSIGELAKSSGICVLVDAEQDYFQQAIEHLTLHLLTRKYNATRPVFYNTLQTYLVKSYDRLLSYKATAEHYNTIMGIKVVRGCYMEFERQHARNTEKDSPIHATKSLTDMSYHHVLEHLMNEVKHNAACIMIASHNKDTVIKALQLLDKMKIQPGDERVTFGQLLGMGDHLTYPLAKAGHIANKVVPYGDMDDIVPFLSRRANENKGMMKNAKDERCIYSSELKRRVWGGTKL